MAPIDDPVHAAIDPISCNYTAQELAIPGGDVELEIGYMPLDIKAIPFAERTIQDVAWNTDQSGRWLLRLSL